MSANHYNWDYRPEVSLANYLQARGYDVWIPGLRGDRGSVLRADAQPFDFDDYARLDMPAAVDAVLEITGQERLGWVGHSMGGMLLYSALTQYPDKVSVGVAISSPATFQARQATHHFGLVSGSLLVGEGDLKNSRSARIGARTPHNALWTKAFLNPDNVDWAVMDGMAEVAIEDTPKALSRQSTLWLKTGRFVDTEGKDWVEPREVPLLVFGGADDHIVSWQDARAACSIYPDCTFVLLSEDEGFAADYGHLDAVLGLHVQTEVYPLVEAHLRAVLKATPAGVPVERTEPSNTP